MSPTCPRCFLYGGQVHPLGIAKVFAGTDDDIESGIIRCGAETCQQEYPIIDGAPVLVPNVREYVAAYAGQINQRHDLHTELSSLISDCLSPDDTHNLTRFYLSSYGSDGFSDLLSEGASALSLVRLLESCLELYSTPEQAKSGVMVELGCATGRACFELARTGIDCVLGVDTNFSFVQFAQRLMRQRRGVLARRKVGLVYEDREFELPFESLDKVDFWVCDAQSLPLRSASIDNVIGLNVLDSVHAPAQLLAEIGRILKARGEVVLATPFDWSTTVTPVENWIGGHSQRGDTRGDPVAVLKKMFPMNCIEGRLVWASELDQVAWSSSRSARSTSEYQEYVFSLSKAAS